MAQDTTEPGNMLMATMTVTIMIHIMTMTIPDVNDDHDDHIEHEKSAPAKRGGDGYCREPPPHRSHQARAPLRPTQALGRPAATGAPAGAPRCAPPPARGEKRVKLKRF